jgi:hypothetical protein
VLILLFTKSPIAIFERGLATNPHVDSNSGEITNHLWQPLTCAGRPPHGYDSCALSSLSRKPFPHDLNAALNIAPALIGLNRLRKSSVLYQGTT